MSQPEHFSLHPHARFRVIDDEGVFVLQEQGEVLVVNRVAAALVNGVREGASRAEQDVGALLRDLVAAGALVARPPEGPA